MREREGKARQRGGGERGHASEREGARDGYSSLPPSGAGRENK